MPTSVHGPFLVVDHAVNTKVQVMMGDTIGVSASGEIDFGGAVLGIGAPIVGPDGDDPTHWPTPSNYPAPSLNKNSLVCAIGTSMVQGGAKTSFVSPASGVLKLLPNDATPEDNSRGWTVTVYHTTADSVAPPVRKWDFSNLTGGEMPAAVVLRSSVAGTNAHLFYTDGGKLRYASVAGGAVGFQTVIDGDGGGGGRTSNPIRWQVSATTMDEAVHVFYFEDVTGALRHAMSSDTVNWTVEVVDGKGGGGGRINGIVGAFNACVAQESTPPTPSVLHVFYYASTNRDLGPGSMGEGVATNDLRHAQMGAGGWSFETVDGDRGADGRVNANVGQTISAVTDPSNELNVFYYDATNTNLRHARLPISAGADWKVVTFDGSGDPNPSDPTTGQTRADAGLFPAATLGKDDQIYVFYWDRTYENVRYAWGLQDSWSYAKLDGGGGPNGRTQASVGQGLMAAITLTNEINLFYFDNDGENIRHAWKNVADPDWLFEVVDGNGGGGGRVTDHLSPEIAAIAPPDPAGSHPIDRKDPLEIFYRDVDSGQLRNARRS
jgi:hypothetical protein